MKDGEVLGLLDVIGTVAVVAAAPDLLVTVAHGIGILETLAVMILMTATRKEEEDVTVVLLAARMIVVIVTETFYVFHGTLSQSDPYDHSRNM